MSNEPSDAGPVDEPSGVRRGVWEARLADLVVIGLGIVCLVGAGQIRVPRGYAPVPAHVMPTVVGLGLVVLGALMLLRSLVQPDLDQARRIAAEAVESHPLTAGVLLGVLVGYVVALGPVSGLPSLGYVGATSILVPLVARVLGSRSLVRDVIVGVAIALVVYLAFTKFLGVRLPAGILDPVLP